MTGAEAAERMIRETIASIERLMREKGVTRSELAARMKVSPARVTQMLGTNTNLTLSTIALVYHCLGEKPMLTLLPNQRPDRVQDWPRLKPEKQILDWDLYALCA